MDAYCGDDEEYSTATRFYCHPCVFECFGRPKQVGKWDNQPCLACGKTLLDEEIWNDIPECERTCDVSWATPEEIKTIKDNPSEPLELDWDAEPIINLLDPEQFHEHYQELAPTREE
ncbi:hypothetical protein G9A89_022639 [Geosiphon pyriformis]|nr:hypothetical protein G9A89_022639 [Geosiphon pyriformis]